MKHDIRVSASTEEVERAIARVARRQYGLVSRSQALQLGATRSFVQTRLSTGRLETVFLGVYRMAGSAPCWRQGLMAACLAAGDGAVASWRAATRLWDLPGFTRELLEISIPHTARRVLPGVIVHRPRDLARRDRTRVDAIPVTTATRTLIDLAGAEHIDAVEEALDAALRRGVTSVAALHRRLNELARNGRPGVRALRALLQVRVPGAVPESIFETRLLRVIRRARLPDPVTQYEVFDRGRFIARVDFAYPEVKLAIEADGYEHHSSRAPFDADRARLNRLTAAGWVVLHVTWSRLRDEPDRVTSEIARVLGARRHR